MVPRLKKCPRRSHAIHPDGYILFKTSQDEETIRTEVGVHMLTDREPDFFFF